jgi:hypothetical protein
LRTCGLLIFRTAMSSDGRSTISESEAGMAIDP